MGILKRIRQYMDNSPTLKPYLLMWLRKTTKTINKWPEEKFIKGVMDCYKRRMGYTFDLQNPKLFNEKLQWYKIYYKMGGRIEKKWYIDPSKPADILRYQTYEEACEAAIKDCLKNLL